MVIYQYYLSYTPLNQPQNQSHSNLYCQDLQYWKSFGQYCQSHSSLSLPHSGLHGPTLLEYQDLNAKLFCLIIHAYQQLYHPNPLLNHLLLNLRNYFQQHDICFNYWLLKVIIPIVAPNNCLNQICSVRYKSSFLHLHHDSLAYLGRLLLQKGLPGNDLHNHPPLHSFNSNLGSGFDFDQNALLVSSHYYQIAILNAHYYSIVLHLDLKHKKV